MKTKDHLLLEQACAKVLNEFNDKMGGSGFASSDDGEFSRGGKKSPMGSDDGNLMELDPEMDGGLGDDLGGDSVSVDFSTAEIEILQKVCEAGLLEYLGGEDDPAVLEGVIEKLKNASGSFGDSSGGTPPGHNRLK